MAIGFMKYDSSMKQFHDDIVHVIKKIIFPGKQRAKELSEEGSPAPLREFLKKGYGMNNLVGENFRCMSSSLIIEFKDRILNDEGANLLQLSWSQVATFIRNNSAEIFDESEDGSKKINIKTEISSPSIEILDLDVKSFNALKRAGVNTIADIEAQTEHLGSTIPPKQWENIINALNAYKGMPIPGSLVEEDMLGEELTFDEIAEMVGEIIIKDFSTVSHAWYKAVKVEKILTCEGDGRRLVYYDGSNQRGIVSEMYFDKDQRSPVRAWRVKLPDKPNEQPVAEFPSCSCPLWKDNAFTNIGNRKPALSFSCNAYYTENVEDTSDFDKIERRCNDHLNCAYFLVHELTPLIKDKSIKINANTPLDELKHLYETFSSSSELAAAPEEPAAPATFDYAAIDSDTADKLRQCENVIRQETSGYFTLLGAKFKEAHDILANHSSGTFEQWYRSMGFKRQTVYNLIQRYEFISSPTIGGHEETFENLPLTLSYEVSKPTAPAELVEKVLEGDITTHKEYIALKKELEEAEAKKKFWIKANSDTNKENQQLRADRNIALSRADNAERKLSEAEAKIKELNENRERNVELEERDDALQRKNDALVIKNQELEQRVKELESRPVDVAVQSDEEAMSEKDEEIAELKALIDRLSDKDVKIFAIKLTLDEYETLLDLVSSSPLIKNAVSAAKILRI